ncbi:AAA domain-containing protein [Acinetobacter baumannii]|uniref:AAA domain-containing protein n=1 Tax=Acinetobacter baumannii TaxID=470 RepID=UPI002341F646|nr:AAA domain-containing protein [Acinetobacter baumannii]MDC4399552.1 AAA domain-containing protein [Acinetobacter baumannii]MDK2106685.1 AAA domain-containing protein [Acinetobacter baumannii]MDK2112020.1 AAA domain-containing protein [Acinetobacter baumannii]MDK2141485.1 AAA domain-containing protein [Acinetobacter baumannii]MDK2152401.1 AAA domain-containing protein [Acinetobacter baumannii]
MIDINTPNLSAQQKNLISKINIEIQKQSKDKRWEGLSFFTKTIGNQTIQYDLIILTNVNIICVEFYDVNGKITLDQHKNWWVNNERLISSPLIVSAKKAQKLATEIKSIKHQFHNAEHLEKNPHFLPKVLNFLVMTGNVDWSALRELPFANRILSLEEFCQLVPTEDFYVNFSISKKPLPWKAKQLHRDFDILNNLLRINARPIEIPLISGYNPHSLLIVHPRKFYKIYSALSIANDKAMIKQWDFSKLSEHNLFVNKEYHKDIINNSILTLNSIKIKNPQLYQKCLVPVVVDFQKEVDYYFDEIVELPDSNHISLHEYLQTARSGLTKKKLDLIQSMLYTISELHKLKIAHGDLNSSSIWLDGNHKIKLSQFSSAFNPNFELAEEVRIVLPQLNQNISLDKKITPFQKDVYWIAFLTWQIVEGNSVTSSSTTNTFKKLKDKSWLTDLLKQANNFEFKDATDFLNNFLRERPNLNIEHKVSSNFLNAYIKNEDLELYLNSNNKILSENLRNPLSSYECLYYKAKLDKLDTLRAQRSKGYTPEIKSFGINQNEDGSKTFYSVIQPINLPLWKDSAIAKLDFISKKQLAVNFIESLQHYHHLQYGYGQLSDETVHVDLEHLTIKLSKVLEPESASQGPFDPSDIEMPTVQQRDNHALLQMLKLIFKPEFKYKKFKWLSEAFSIEFEQDGGKYLDLTRFLEALLAEGQEEQVPLLIVKKSQSWGNDDEEDSDNSNIVNRILPDNGKIYGQIKQIPGRDIEIELWGIGGKVSLFYTDYQQNPSVSFRYVSQKSFIPKKLIDKSDFELNICIQVEDEKSFNKSTLPKLTDYLLQNDDFYHAIQQFKQEKSAIEDQSEVSELALVTDVIDYNEMSTKELWRLIKDTEEEALPIVELIDVLKPIRSNHYTNYYKANYESVQDNDVLDRFQKKDKVYALLVIENKDGEFETKPIGEVDMVKSTRGTIYIKNCKLTRLKEGSRITLQNVAEQSSNRKRKVAIDNILKNRSVIPNLIDYFEKNSTAEIVEYEVGFSDQQLDYYTSIQKGKTIALNETQRKAFEKIITNGPVSVLQGPPGTGKTEFISALVHYLFHHQLVKNILVVSQSHEAVNTTVERIRQRFTRYDQDISIVRISNKADLVSTDLLDTYSGSIIESQQAFFQETLVHRILTLGANFQLDKKYLLDLIHLKVEIFEKIRQMRCRISEEDEPDTISSFTFKEFVLYQLQCLTEIYELDTSGLDSDVTSEVFWQEVENPVMNALAEEYGIDPEKSEKAQALICLAKDCETLIDAPHANYERFLAQTRQIVCGTCVGIGNNSIDIANQVYDFVIIDEAARSSSSELAIAMQTGKRILLVGDHKQLPPLYSSEHSDLLKKKLGIANRTELDNVLKSDFEHVFDSPYGKQISAQLLQQYRMAPAIGHMVSDCFYDGRLQTAVCEPIFDNEDTTKRVVPAIYYSTKVKELQSTVTWVDTGGKGAFHKKVSNEKTSLYNPHEIKEILDFLHRIDSDQPLLERVNQQVKKDEAAIGIICAYAEQKKQLKKLFIASNFSTLLQKSVKIDTVDSYQGKENRIVVFSVTRNAPDFSSAFLGSENRVNVALSRSMDRLVIFGASEMWEHKKNSDSPLYKSLAYIKKRLNKPEYQILKRRNEKVQGVKKG